MWNQNNLPDCGPGPFITDLDQDILSNQNFRTARWTGSNLQLTLMCIPAGSEIGLEIHPKTDQFLYIVSGNGIAIMGKQRNCLTCRRCVSGHSAVFVPAGTWHNIKNTGNIPLKLFSVYAPPQHPSGTIDCCKPSEDD